MLNPLTVWIATNCGIFLKRWESQTLNCLLRNLCAGQEATVRNGHGTMVWFQTGKGIRQVRISLPCLFTLYAEMLGWMTYNLESRLLGEIAAASDMQMILL